MLGFLCEHANGQVKCRDNIECIYNQAYAINIPTTVMDLTRMKTCVKVYTCIKGRVGFCVDVIIFQQSNVFDLGQL